MEGPNAEIYCKTCYVREYFTGGRNKFCDPGTNLNLWELKNFGNIHFGRKLPINFAWILMNREDGNIKI